MPRDFVRNGSVLFTFDAQYCLRDLHFPDVDHASFFQVLLEYQSKYGESMPLREVRVTADAIAAREPA